MVQLLEIEKVISQLLIAHGTVENSKLEKLLELIIKDFKKEKLRPLRDHFARINGNLRLLSMEIKSVRIPNTDSSSSTKWLHHHGIVNTEEDDVSKDVGSEMSPEDLKFFSDIIVKLLEVSNLSTDEVYGMKGDKWTLSYTDSLLSKLILKGWLQRDERSFWEIGTRTYLELRSFIEEAMPAPDDGDDTTPATRAKNLADQIAKLPQITTY